MGCRPFRLGGWVGSDLFEERLNSHPCGCELAREALRSDDHRARLELAETQQASWACPEAGYSGESDDEAAHAVLDAMSELTGVARSCLRTCPRWHAHRPEIVRATAYKRYVEAGCPDAIENDPPVALIRASHLVAGADAARLKAERDERENKRGRPGQNRD